METLQAELSRKEGDLCALQTQQETWQRQSEDHQRHITLLREQVSAKEQQIAMLQADVCKQSSLPLQHADTVSGHADLYIF